MTNRFIALIFVFTLGLLSCTNASSEQKNTEAEPNSGTAVIVKNDEVETVPPPTPDSTDKVAAKKADPPTPEAKPNRTKVNKKPVATGVTENTVKEPTTKAATTAVAQEAPKPVIQATPDPSKEPEETLEEKQMEKPSVEQEEQPKVPKASHDAWDGLLKKYVSADGKVNYQGFKTSKSELESYLEHLSQNPVQSSWSRNEQMAYWINAYNAFTVKLIVDNYPVNSIMDLHGGKPWDVKWIKLGNKTYSLNNIEHDILRPQFNEPRIHFAVNCAAKSCPPLLNRAWRANTLNSTFDQQAKSFINNPKYNKISAKQVQISKIFEWYASDFGNIISYLNKYADTTIKANAKVSYLEYDWALNKE